MANSRASSSGSTSCYHDELQGEERRRYEAKIAMCGLDPFTLKATDLKKDWKLWPQLDAGDIIDYLVRKTSYLTRKEMKAYKSLEAHNYLTSGWVKEPSLKTIGTDAVVVVSEVNHSQSLSAPPLKVWLLMKNDGEVVIAHCTCMAGHGEACSHVAAILFYFEVGLQMRDEASCTDSKSVWLPAHVKSLVSVPVADMDFSSSVMKKRRLSHEVTPLPPKQVRVRAPAPSEDEWKVLFDNVTNSGLRPAVAATDPRYSDMYVPKISSCTASYLLQLFDHNACDLTWEELQAKTASLAELLEMDDSTIVAIEQKTRRQSDSVLWYKYRSGRITASNFRSICHTSLADPSKSLLERICYPQRNRFSTAATRYGIENEPKAIAAYEALATAGHECVTFRRPGLMIAKGRPFLAATPDLLVECACCGKGVVEVKCPYKLRDVPLKSAAKDPESCVTLTDDELTLKDTHAYYYQVQLQMLVCNVDYADFLLWNAKGSDVQRIVRNNGFLCAVVDHAAKFFSQVLLPELVAHWFTRQPTQQQDHAALGPSLSTAVPHESNAEPTYCVCSGPEEGKMIACDNENCVVGWFHFRCVGLKTAPRKKQWFCSTCKTQRKAK
ncbi:unnamed protein product [Ixodes pacificus]